MGVTTQQTETGADRDSTGDAAPEDCAAATVPSGCAQAAALGTCCPYFHEAIELVGRRWTGAILSVLLAAGPLRFSEVAQAVPELSDRLLSARMKELEARGIVERRVIPGPPLRVEYALSQMGVALGPALEALKAWGQHWLACDGDA